MTLLQLKVAIATSELKSVTAAAKLLNLSQPNASNCLRLLEDELGFPVMLRTGAGATVTPKGAAFLKHARNIIEENERILSLRDSEEEYRLRLGTVNYYAAAEPFFTLCAEHRDDAKADFQIFNVTVSDGIRHLTKRNIDVLAVAVMKHQISSFLSMCEAENIEHTSVCEVPSIIIMRKGHPAATDGRCLNITQGSDVMKEFPYVALKSLSEDLSMTEYNDSDFVQCSYKIWADDTNVRLRIIEETNGFGFGLVSSYKLMSRFALTCFPVPDVTPELFCLTRHGESDRHEIKEYISLLKKELLSII